MHPPPEEPASDEADRHSLARADHDSSLPSPTHRSPTGTHRVTGEVEPTPEQSAEDYGFPILILAGPACLCLFFLGTGPSDMTRATAITVITIAAAIAALCFGLIAAKHPEPNVRYGALAGIALTLGMFAFKLLDLVG